MMSRIFVTIDEQQLFCLKKLRNIEERLTTVTRNLLMDYSWTNAKCITRKEDINWPVTSYRIFKNNKSMT